MIRSITTLSVLLAAGALRAAEFDIRLKALQGEASIPAESREGRVMVDVAAVARGLGAGFHVRDTEYVIQNASGTVALNTDGFYRVRKAGQRKWRAAGLKEPGAFSGPRFMVSLQDLPELFQRTFTYHLQKRELTEDAPLSALIQRADTRPIAVRQVRENRKDWLALEDVARALGVVVYSALQGRYTLVMPDFTLLELRVGELWIYKQNARYKSMDDPLLLLSGAPHATVASLSALFDAPISWDAAARQALVPARYGRVGEVKLPEREPLTVVGYLPKPLRVDVEELSAFYQTPSPIYAADAPDLYESVRDILTNLPVDPHTSGYDQWSGEAQFALEGSAGGRPLTGGVRLEKVGTRGRLNSGSLRWGFPGLQVKGGRDYLKVADFNNQFDLVDHVEVSHSNDTLGEGRKPFEWGVRALAGEGRFLVFASTEILSQTISFRQGMAAGGVDAGWRRGPQRLWAGFTHYAFRNHAREVSADFNFDDQDLVDFGLPADTNAIASRSLTSSVLTDGHALSLLEFDYKWDNALQLTAAGARSRHKESTGARASDDAWRAAATVGTASRKVGGSFESTGPLFRSLSDPLRYQDRRITRFSTNFAVAAPWVVYGEARRESYTAKGRTDQTPYRYDSFYAGNLLNFRRFETKALVNYSGYTGISKRWAANWDYTQHLGRDSIETGIGWSEQWYGNGRLFKQAYTARLGGQVLRPSWRLSLSQELIRNHYPVYILSFDPATFAVNGYRKTSSDDRWAGVTQVFAQLKSWETMLQYGLEPRYHNRDPRDLYTGYLRLGWQPNDKKIFNVFYAVTALDRGLKHPEVWRAGLGFSNDFY